MQVNLDPLIARLREIQRKCGSMGSRNEEFPLMEERLGSIIGRLEAGEEPSGEPLRYRDVARELFPVAHLFESYGFMTVGKEIAHVERSLRDLEPDAPPEQTSAAPSSPLTPAEPAVAPEDLGGHDATREEVEEEGPPAGIPRPVIVGLLVLLTAIATVVALVILREPVRRQRSAQAPPASARVAATIPPAAEATPSPVRRTTTMNPAARLAEEVGLARLALNAGDTEGAVDHLSRAALVDVNDASVLETAQRIVDSLIGAANRAVDRGEWELAEEHLERAQSVARRFSLSISKAESARRRHAAMERFRLLAPDDTHAILAAAGERVLVRLLNGSSREGHVHGVDGAHLLLDVDSKVGGGTVRYTDSVPLAEIRDLKVYED